MRLSAPITGDIGQNGTRMVKLTEKVKRIAQANEIDYIGVAPVDRFANAPEGHKPDDLLPGAGAVISMGMRINLGPQLTQRMALANNKLRHISFSYRWFGYAMLNLYFLDRAAFLVVKLLEEAGHIAVPIVASGVEDLKNLMAAFSNRHAAVAAGLGELGWSGLVLTPDVGPRVRLVSVITTANLTLDPMYTGPKLCDPDRCKELGQGLPLCAAVCPVDSFSIDSTVEAIIGGRKFEYGLMNHHLCGLVGLGLHPKVLGPKNMTVTKKAGSRTGIRLSGEPPPEYQLESTVYGRGHFCGLCLLECPVGKPELVDHFMKEFRRR